MIRNHNIDEACEILNISNAMLYKLWRMGKGPKVTKIGRRTFVTSSALEEYLKSIEKNDLNSNV